MTERILLTGASGFLGSRLLQRLAGGGGRIVCLGRRRPAAEFPHVEFCPGDLLAKDVCRRAMEGCETVVHLAAATGKHLPPAEYFRINAEGTGVLVEAARQVGVQRFLYVSTIAVKFRDISRYPYAQSKQRAEAVVMQSGVPWTIVRPTMIFGPGSPVLEGLRRLAALPLVPLFGDGRAQVQPIFVDDLAAALETILKEAACARRTIEIGGGQILTIEELLMSIRHELGIGNRRVIHLPAQPMAACLAWVEPFLRPWLPLTAGQLATFTNDGTAERKAGLAGWHAGMQNLEDMLAPVKKAYGPV